MTARLPSGFDAIPIAIPVAILVAVLVAVLLAVLSALGGCVAQAPPKTASAGAPARHLSCDAATPVVGTLTLAPDTRGGE